MPERAAGSVARVVLASPLPQLDRVFEYRVPERLRAEAGVGMRVRVPVRSARRRLEGFIVGLADRAEYGGRLAELAELVSPVRVLAPALLELCTRVARRQAGQTADVLRLAIPARHVGAERAWLRGLDGEPPEPDPAAVRAARRDLSAVFGEAAGPLLAAPEPRLALRPPTGVVPGTDAAGRSVGVPAALSALARIAVGRLAAGEDVLLLVPDFRDVELAHAALRPLVPPGRIRRLDGRAQAAERYRDFLAGLDRPDGAAPPARIVLGTRSAVYAPTARPACILVWDDGDESYAEPHAPYPHTRELALLRHELAGGPLVLASHAPSPACARLVELGWLGVVEPLRPPGPPVLPSDAVAEAEAGPARIPSIAWRTAAEALDRGPVLVQVARAGYAPALACQRCRHPARCTRCHGPLRISGRLAVPACGLCGHAAPGWRCEACGHDGMRARVLGAERTAEDLGRAFPKVRVVVADGASGTVSIDGRPALVIATRGAEPVPPAGYAAVLLLDGERMLARETLEAADEALRGWSNAAALLDAGDRDARVVLVGGASAAGEALRSWRQPAAAARELAERRALDFPPAVRAARIEAAGAAELERALDGIAGLEGLRVDGPVPAEEGDGVRATIRFPYRIGEELAAALRAEVVRAATSGRRPVAGRAGERGVGLRVRMDPPRLF